MDPSSQEASCEENPTSPATTKAVVVCIASTISPPYHHHSRAKGTLYLGNITLDNVGTTFRPPERSILALSQDIEGRRREGPGFAAGVDEATAFLRIGSQ